MRNKAANLPQQWEECQVDNGPPDDHESEEFWEECQVDNEPPGDHESEDECQVDNEPPGDHESEDECQVDNEPPADHESEEFYWTSWANLPQQWEEALFVLGVHCMGVG